MRAELERLARLDDRSASHVANLAIRAYVDERRATRDLVHDGLREIDAGGPGAAPEDVHDWLLSEEDVPFPLPPGAD